MWTVVTVEIKLRFQNFAGVEWTSPKSLTFRVLLQNSKRFIAFGHRTASNGIDTT